MVPTDSAIQGKLMARIHPVILSGGAGTRLWPQSRAMYPKQLLPLISERSMIQETAARVSDSERFSPGIIVSNNDHRFIIAAQLEDMGYETDCHILEPAARNTAPAVISAALYVLEKHGGGALLVLAADHHIRDVKQFHYVIEIAHKLAEAGELVTFGIKPTGPETGYGYIRAEEVNPHHPEALVLAEFVEKPDRPTAEQYIASGDYYWNSGIFMFDAATLIDEAEKHCPDILQSCRDAVKQGVGDLDFFRLGKDAFEGCRSDSIDYAIMEKAETVATVPVEMGWNDIGSWSALWEVGDKDAHDNVTIGDVISTGTRGSYVRSEDSLIATVGVEDLVVVQNKDVVLVADKSKVQDVKDIVAQIAAQDRDEHLLHKKVYRPWGFYESIQNGERYQVKLLSVDPGASLSLQYHHKRAEHWVVVSGKARVTIGDKVSDLEANESVYIAIGETHRLENPFDEPVQIIEVQTGSYLGEDDIVRLEDVYGRKED